MQPEYTLILHDDPPASDAVVRWLNNAGEQPDPELVARFVWEVSRTRDSDQALRTAKFASMLQSAAEPQALSESLDELRDAVHRHPLTVASGEHQQLDDDGKLMLVNLAGEPVDVAVQELHAAQLQIADGTPITVVVEETDQPAARTADDGRLIWTLPVTRDADGLAWQELARECGLPHGEQSPDWLAAMDNFRHPIAPADALPSELRVRSNRIRAMLTAILTMFAYGERDNLRELSEEGAQQLLTAIDVMIDRYTSQLQVALSATSIADLLPLEPWQRAPYTLKSLVNTVTGDDPKLSAVLNAGPVRAGTLTVTGDPDGVGHDLLGITAPPVNCSLLLKPEALSRTVFLPGRLHPAAKVAVPQLKHGFYCTTAVGEQVRDLLRTSLYFELSPAMGPDALSYLQGREQHLAIPDAGFGPSFQAIIETVSSALNDDGTLDPALLERPLRATVLGALSRVLTEPGKGVTALVCGHIQLSDIAEVVVTLNTQEEFQHLVATGEAPVYIEPARNTYQQYGIKVRMRSPDGVPGRPDA